MQKTLAFLEQHVQWLALALGGVFFFFCVWAYVITPPAVATVTTVNGKKEPVTPSLIDDMTKEGPVQEIDRAIKDNSELAIVVPDVVKPWQMQMDSSNAKPIVVGWTPQWYVKGLIDSGPNVDVKVAGNMVTAVPSLPKATPLALSAGLSVVSMPPAVGQKNAGGAQAVAASNFDQLWATASFTIPAKDLQAALAAVLANKGQGLQLTTDILHVELQRQRGTPGPNGPVFPSGEEGVESVAVPKMLQADARPLPDPKASIPEKASYYDWAEKNIDLVYQPKFYDVRGGTPWVAPSPAPAAGAAAPAVGVAGIPLAPRPVAPPNPNIPGGATNAGHNPGEMNPNAITQDILIWAHDDTVQPGQSYRYRVVYYMKNPVVNLAGIGAANIVDILAVKSPPSDWSQPITLPQTTKFWFASLRGNNASADVFHWENGVWTKKAGLPFSPGDRVADSDWTVIDVHGSAPGAREREKYVLLTNDAGDVMRRYTGSDKYSEEYKALNAEVNPTSAGGGTTPKDAGPTRNPVRPATPPANGNRAAPMPRGG